MANYHVNPETGMTNQCFATVQSCKFSENGETPPHFPTRESAQSYYEGKMSNEDFMESARKAPPESKPSPSLSLTRAYEKLQKAEAQLLYGRVDKEERKRLESEQAQAHATIAQEKSSQTVARLAQALRENKGEVFYEKSKKVGTLHETPAGWRVTVIRPYESSEISLGLYRDNYEGKLAIAGFMRSQGYTL